jgi:hypothetical protein
MQMRSQKPNEVEKIAHDHAVNMAHPTSGRAYGGTIATAEMAQEQKALSNTTAEVPRLRPLPGWSIINDEASAVMRSIQAAMMLIVRERRPNKQARALLIAVKHTITAASTKAQATAACHAALAGVPNTPMAASALACCHVLAMFMSHVECHCQGFTGPSVKCSTAS